MLFQLLEGWWATGYLCSFKRCRLFINRAPLPMGHTGAKKRVKTSLNCLQASSCRWSSVVDSPAFRSILVEYGRLKPPFHWLFFAAHFFKNEEGRVLLPITKRFWLWQNPRVAPQWSRALTNSLRAVLLARARYRAGSGPLFLWALLLLVIIICG